MENLEELFLPGNMFSSLRPEAFVKLPRPLSFEVIYNPLKCDPRLCWLHQEEAAGTITWPSINGTILKPNCSDGTDWDEITWNCKYGKHHLLARSITGFPH